MKYFCNPAFFTDDKHVVDKLKIIKSMSTLKLLFFDLKQMVQTTSSYACITYIFAILDKISNLICHIHGTEGSRNESKIFKQLLKDKHKEYLVKTYNEHIENLQLRSAFIDTVKLCYDEMLTVTNKTTLDESSKLLRSLRNINHGASLNKEQYQSLFVSESITMPKSLKTLPVLVIISIGLNPKEYFNQFLNECDI